MKIINQQVSKDELAVLAKERFGDMVKAVVDVRQGIMAVGGELHADAEQKLLEQGSQQTDLWGINIYPQQPRNEWIEFDSMINVRPAQGNRSRSVEDPGVQKKIIAVVDRLVP